MASAVFTLEDTKEARTELSLLLQIESSQLNAIVHEGLITVEFPDLPELIALQVLSRAVANHGFVVDMSRKPAKKSAPPVEQKPEPKEVQAKAKQGASK